MLASFSARCVIPLFALNIVLLLPAAMAVGLQVEILPSFLRRQFNPNAEANLFAWYSSALLLLLAALCGLHCQFTSASRRTQVCWLLFGLLALSLSIEEIAGFHEAIAHSLPNRLGIQIFATRVCRVWLLAYAPLILIGAFTLGWAAFHLSGPDRISRNLMLTGAALWLAVLAVEGSNQSPSSSTVWQCNFAQVLEETLEIFGATLLILAVLRLTEIRFLGRWQLATQIEQRRQTRQSRFAGVVPANLKQHARPKPS